MCFIVKQTTNKTKKQKTRACITIQPHKSQYFVEPPFAEITAASLLGYVSRSLAHLATGIFALFQGKTASAPSSWMGSASVQQSLSHTTDSQLY